MTDTRKGTALAVASSFGAAAFLIPYGLAGQSAPPQSLALAMLICAALLGTLTTPWWSGGKLALGKVTLVVSALLGVGTVIGNIGMAAALTRIEPALTSVILQTEILLVALLAALWLGERITLRFVIGATLAIAGFVVMRIPGASSATMDLGGAAWACIAALAFALMHVITRRTIRRIDPRAVNALRLWLAVAFLALLPGNASNLVALEPRVWLLAASAALCGPIFGRLCMMYALRHIPAAHARLTGLLSPVFAFVLALVLLGSAPSARELAGGAIILLGVAIPLFSAAAEATEPPT
jgi:drug/metabolite transporter (DMT)-like permease